MAAAPPLANQILVHGHCDNQRPTGAGHKCHLFIRKTPQSSHQGAVGQGASCDTAQGEKDITKMEHKPPALISLLGGF